MPMPRPPLIAISLLSACMLAYEVLLTRLFSIVLWHHFAYMIISAAMLGYGASGTALALLKEKIAPHFDAVYITAAAGMAFLMPAAFLLAQQVPYNPLELLWDKTQPAKLLAIYLLMMLPFFCGGLSIGLIWWRFGREAGRIYAFDILGAGAGSLGVIGILFLVPPQKVSNPAYGNRLAGRRDRHHRTAEEAKMADGRIYRPGFARGCVAVRGLVESGACPPTKT